MEHQDHAEVRGPFAGELPPLVFVVGPATAEALRPLTGTPVLVAEPITHGQALADFTAKAIETQAVVAAADEAFRGLTAVLETVAADLMEPMLATAKDRWSTPEVVDFWVQLWTMSGKPTPTTFEKTHGITRGKLVNQLKKRGLFAVKAVAE